MSVLCVPQLRESRERDAVAARERTFSVFVLIVINETVNDTGRDRLSLAIT